jgi:hypothetical protein
MHHDTHGHDSGAEAAGAASWLVAMVLFIVLAVAVIIALFAWAPWDDDNVGGGTGTNTEENNPDIQGDISINDNTDPNSGNNQQPQPGQ